MRMKRESRRLMQMRMTRKLKPRKRWRKKMTRRTRLLSFMGRT